MEDDKKPLYEVGQVVMMKSGKGDIPFRILARIEEHGGYFYAWNRKNYAAESMIRALTPQEAGTK